MSAVEGLGWVATAAFVASYACRSPVALRRVQAGAATLWITYGLLIQAAPVVVANALVALVAIGSSAAARRPRAGAPVVGPSR